MQNLVTQLLAKIFSVVLIFFKGFSRFLIMSRQVAGAYEMAAFFINKKEIKIV